MYKGMTCIYMGNKNGWSMSNKMLGRVGIVICISGHIDNDKICAVRWHDPDHELRDDYFSVYAYNIMESPLTLDEVKALESINHTIKFDASTI